MTIDNFRLMIEYLRNYSNFINEKTERLRLNKSKNVDLTGQGDTTNLQSSIVNFQFGSGSFSKNLTLPEAVMFSKSKATYQDNGTGCIELANEPVIL